MAGKFPWGAPGRNHSFFCPRRPPKSILGGSWRRPCAQEAPGPPKTPSGEPFWTNFWCFLDVFSCCARVRCLLFFGSVVRLICVSVFFFFNGAQKRAHAQSTGPANTFPCFFKVRSPAGAATTKQNHPRKHSPKKLPENDKIHQFLIFLRFL